MTTESGAEKLVGAVAGAAVSYVATRVFAFFAIVALMIAFWIETWFGWVSTGIFMLAVFGSFTGGQKLHEALLGFIGIMVFVLPVAAIINWIA